MKFADIRSFFFLTLIVSVYGRKNRKSTIIRRVKPSYYGELEKSVFIHNGKYFTELLLDDKRALDVNILRHHCGSDVKGLQAHSTSKTTLVISMKLQLKDGWDVFESYKCIYPPHKMKPPALATTPSTHGMDTSSNEIKVLRKEIREMREEQAKKDEIVLATIMEFQLRTFLFDLGEAARILRKIDTHSAKTRDSSTEIDNCDELLRQLAEKRNYAAHSITCSKERTENLLLIEENIENVLRAYRYLICTGRPYTAHKYVKRGQIDALVRLTENFRTSMPIIAKNITLILNSFS